jgi:ABC-2 type transport system permease protein
MKMLGLVMYNETYKRLLILWRYKFSMVMKLLGVMLIFVGACFLIPSSLDMLAPLLLGSIVWFYARFVVSAAVSDLVTEAREGTLEQVYMSPVRTDFLLLARLIALLISTTIMVSLPTLGMMLVLHITIPFRLAALIVFIITLMGLFGFSLMLSGVMLVFKQVDALVGLVQILMLFLSGAFMPISHFPGWLALLANALPITQGIYLLQNIVFSGQSLATAWANGSMTWLVINTMIYVCIGLAVYRWGEHISKIQGSLGQY